MKNLLGVVAAVAAMTSAVQAQAPTEKAVAEAIVRGAQAERSGAAAFVRVADGALFFSRQVGAADVARDARAQAEEALEAVVREVVKAGGDARSLVRLNVYLADKADAAAVEAVIAARLAAHPVAITWVGTPLAVTGARVAFDVVAAVMRAAGKVEWLAGGAVLPAGAKVFISGQVERGATPTESVRRTMEALHRTSEELGLSRAEVVQVKVFLQPWAERAAAEREVVATFGGAGAPPVVMMEWTSTSHAEIEVVVSGVSMRAAPAAGVSYLSMPGKAVSPRFSHIAVVGAGTPLIFLGGIDAGPGVAPREQWKRMFERLGSVLFDAGSGYRHLVKATYFTEDSPARGVLNEIRGVYYDPARPPAASAVGVRSVGRGERAFHLDMIAVPMPVAR